MAYSHCGRIGERPRIHVQNEDRDRNLRFQRNPPQKAEAFWYRHILTQRHRHRRRHRKLVRKLAQEMGQGSVG